MQILIIIITLILPLLIGYILGKNRDSDKIVFNKKLEIYSDIIYHLSSAKYTRLDLDNSMKKLKAFTEKVANQHVNEFEESKIHPVIEKYGEMEGRVRLINYTDELVKLFAPARLIGSREVVDELRVYFSLFSDYSNPKDIKDKDVLANKVSESSMELEQLMRKDLGNLRILSNADISWHIQKDKL